MEKRIFALGEALIDYIEENNSINPYVGGAPLNFIAASSIYYPHSFFITLLSTDEKSTFIINEMNRSRLNKNYIFIDEKYNTAYSLISLDENHNRSFTFFKENASFLYLYKLNFINNIQSQDIFYFGTVCLLNNKNITYYHQILQKLKLQNNLILFDPNIRLSLFNKDNIISLIKDFLYYPAILKISDEEYKMVFDNKDIKEVFSSYNNLKLILLTLGENGCILYSKNNYIKIDAIKENIIDTTGAGDTLFGAFIGQLIHQDLDLSNLNLLKPLLKEASLLANKVCSHKGCIPIIR